MNIAVIGAGPVGSYTAYLLSKKSFNVHLFDKKKKQQIGLPIQCTGLFSSEIERFLPLKKEFLTNITTQIDLVSPSNKRLTLSRTEYVLDREKMDKYLLDLAVRQGAKFYPEYKLKKIIRSKKPGLIFENNETVKSFSFDLVIGADGPLSLVYQLLNPGKKKRFYYGVQAIVKGSFDPRSYRVFFGKKICPGFFAWVVPESAKRARIGLAAVKTPGNHFYNFLKRSGINKKQILSLQGGLIPLFDPSDQLNRGKIFLLGDAASCLKATTGGGIVPAFQEARNLVRSISRNKKYRLNMKNLKRHLLIRKILNRFSDRDYDQLISSLSKPKNKKIIENSSRENPKRLISRLIFNEPRLLSFVKYLF